MERRELLERVPHRVVERDRGRLDQLGGRAGALDRQRQDYRERQMSPPRRNSTERLVILEQKVFHMETKLGKMSAKVDEIHAILLQARGVRWTVIAVAALVGFLTGISRWFIAKA
jgi:hypothetical protein